MEGYKFLFAERKLTKQSIHFGMAHSNVNTRLHIIWKRREISLFPLATTLLRDTPQDGTHCGLRVPHPPQQECINGTPSLHERANSVDPSDPP